MATLLALGGLIYYLNFVKDSRSVASLFHLFPWQQSFLVLVTDAGAKTIHMYNQSQACTLVACTSHRYWEPCDNTRGKIMYTVCNQKQDQIPCSCDNTRGKIMSVCNQKQDQTPCPSDYTGEK